MSLQTVHLVSSPEPEGSDSAGANDDGPGVLAHHEPVGQQGLPSMPNLAGQAVSARFVEQVPISYARQHGILGLSADGAVMPVAVGRWDAELVEILNVVHRFLGVAVEPVRVPPDAIAAAINVAYQQREGQAQAVIDSLDRETVLAEIGELEQLREDLLDVSGRAPVIKLVNLVLFEAVRQGASDIHVQPYEERLVVRNRIDGVLFDCFELPKPLQDEVVSRIKVMGRMNIAEKRLPQDGRASVQVGDRLVDLRISTVPASHGERTVIRLLDKSARLYSLGELGMERPTMERFQGLIAREHGIILVTGPTGGGKTTTLYAALQELNAKECNVITLEDPIEYALEGISQIQVSDKKGMTFASGLRSVLRQDPDVIMVGEIRDRETAAMAIQSALTGHLVFSTLHTNDAASAVTRLLDLGVEPYLLASSVIGVLAQRLVRRICGTCRQPLGCDKESCAALGIDPHAITTQVAHGAGCARCRNTGYCGRIGIFELLEVDEPVRRLVQTCSTATQIKATAVASGMRTLRDDGIAKVGAGITTVTEVIRATSGVA